MLLHVIENESCLSNYSIIAIILEGRSFILLFAKRYN